jgi:hypothetical protein
MGIVHRLLLETSINEKQELEYIGDLFINELLSRSFFQEVDIFPFTPYYFFKMHDLIHDLAISIAQRECSQVDFDAKDIIRTIRHLSFSTKDLGQEVPKCLEKFMFSSFILY